MKGSLIDGQFCQDYSYLKLLKLDNPSSSYILFIKISNHWSREKNR